MTDANVSAIIGAISGIVGVLLGNSFVAVKEWLVNNKKDSRDSAYLAIIVVSHLDRFANGCMAVAYDDGTEYGAPSGKDGTYAATVTAPAFLPLDIDVEWKVLPKDLMYDILQIPDKREHIQNNLAGVWEFDDPPDYSSYFDTRQRDYADLGLQVSAIARRLRQHAGMPIEVAKVGVWDRDVAMQDVIKKLDAEYAEYEKRTAESHAFALAALASPTS
jgi:hypothetical protein